MATKKKAPVKAPAKAKAAPKVDYAKEYPFAFRQGRDARRANISEDQMPVLNENEKKAYLLGRNGA